MMILDLICGIESVGLYSGRWYSFGLYGDSYKDSQESKTWQLKPNNNHRNVVGVIVIMSNTQTYMSIITFDGISMAR